MVFALTLPAFIAQQFYHKAYQISPVRQKVNTQEPTRMPATPTGAIQATAPVSTFPWRKCP